MWAGQGAEAAADADPSLPGPQVLREDPADLELRLGVLLHTVSVLDNQLRSRAVEVGEALGKEIITCKDSIGFLVNRTLLPFLNEAIFTLAEGIGTAEDDGVEFVDAAFVRYSKPTKAIP